MHEILFIADDPCILALIENLQPLAQPEIRLESDYSNGIKRIFDTHPAVVFLQHRIGEVTCDKLASQIKMLLDGEGVPLVLLSDEEVMSYSAVSTYEACLDLCLPMDELSRQILQLLQTLPELAREKSAAAAPPGSAGQSETREIISRTGAADCAAPFAVQGENAGSAGRSAPSPAGGGSLEAPGGNSSASARLTDTSEQPEPQFLSDFLTDRFFIEPLPLIFLEDSPGQQSGATAPALQTAAAVEVRPFTDSRRIEKADPSQLFGSMSEPRVEPFFTPAGRIGPKPVRSVAPSAETRSTASYSGKADRKSPPTGSPRQPVAPATEAMRMGSPAGDDLRDPVVAKLGIEKKDGRSYRGLFICTLLVLCIASLVLFFTRRHFAGVPEISRGVSDLDSKMSALHPASAPPDAQPLPQFVPQVPPDSRYAASHPGWERYQADALEYLVYREKGRIRAIQVLSEEQGAITLPFFKTCIRVSTGQEQFDLRKTETRSGFQVISGTLHNGGELIVYREIPDAAIRGFVLSFPASRQTSAEGAKVTAR